MQNLKNKWKSITGIVALMAVLTVTIALNGKGFFNNRLFQTSITDFSGGVTITDDDTTNLGLDGGDITVHWTPATSNATFTKYMIFIIPSTSDNVTLGNMDNFMLNVWDQSVTTISTDHFTGSTLKLTDSGSFAHSTYTAPAALDSGKTYRACVFALDSNGTIGARINCGSSNVALTSESGGGPGPDTEAPFIEHHQVFKATESVDAIINSSVFDNQTTAAQFNDTSDIGSNQEFFQLYYTSSLDSGTVDGVHITGNLFQFTVPNNKVPAAGGTFQYYLGAKDRAENVRYFCSDPQVNSVLGCSSHKFIVTTVTAGTRTVSGKITSGGVAVGSAKVYAAGFAGAAVTTTPTGELGTGNYTISGLPNNSGFNYTAYKDGYCGNDRMEPLGSTNLSGIDININSGACNFSGGDLGGGGKPHVIFSGPPNFANQVPLNEKIRVGFDQALDGTTVNDTNVYLTTDGTAHVAGTVTYCANNSAAGCSALFPQDQKVILFTPTSNLSTNTFYTLIITGAVTTSTGQSIEGNLQTGGHQINFTTSGGNVVIDANNFGSGGQYMPPYVQSANPVPGMAAPGNTKILVTFNDTMNSSTINTDNIKLKQGATPVSITVSLDSNTSKIVTITPGSSLSEGDYEIQMLGAVANASGVSMREAIESSSVAFSSHFKSNGQTDSQPPTIYSSLNDNATGVAVNIGKIQYSASEQLDPSTVTSTKIVLKQAGTAVAETVQYDPSSNNVYVIPNNSLIPDTIYTVTFDTSGITDLAGNATSVTKIFTFTTSADSDTTAPNLVEARCDDFSCSARFDKAMNNKSFGDGDAYNNSVLKKANYVLTIETSLGSGIFGSDIMAASNATISYDPINSSVKINNIGLLSTDHSKKFTLTVNTGLKDLAGNSIDTNEYKGAIENSTQTFGNLSNGGNNGMFGPPQGDKIGGEFKPEGFGGFSAVQMAFGNADTSYPFNASAGKDSNVFQTQFNPGVIIQNNDLFVATFPAGTNISNVIPDPNSPLMEDMNGGGNGTVTFDPTYGTGGVTVDSQANTVTLKLKVTSGPTSANDHYSIDLAKVINPNIPKGPDTSGYTLGIKITRSNEAIVNKTSAPYYINQAGSRSITLKVYAGTQLAPVAGATGNIFIHGGGPSGPMDKKLTLTDGVTTAADGDAIAGDAGVQYTGLQDGCYFLSTDPSVTLSDGNDYFGQNTPSPICVNSGTPTVTKVIELGSTGSTTNVPITVKFAGISNFAGSDIDIFGGGPNKFVVKSLTSVGAPNADGYTLRLTGNGQWFVGVGPGMPKGGATNSKPKSLPGTPPPSVSLNVSNIDTTPVVTTPPQLPPGVTYNSGTRTLTFTFATADKAITGTVKDGSGTGLANVNVFVHSQGFGQPSFTQTLADGTFTVNVANYGTYEIGTFKDGLPSVNQNIEVKNGTGTEIYYKGKKITDENPFIIKMNKAAYYISGKVLDASNNGIAFAPVSATDANGNTVFGGTSQDGSYTLFVDTGTWTVTSHLPPSATDSCGTFSTTVIVSDSNQTSQNITPSAGTCFTLSGTVTLNGSTYNNGPLMVQEYNAITNKVVDNGLFKPTSTDGNGVYTVKVSSGTYKISAWSPEMGEISTTKVVATADINDANLNSGSTGTITLHFTNGTADMQAFAELKKADDPTNTSTNKNFSDLTADQTFTVKAGNYNYFIHIDGVGDFNGSAASGDTKTIDLTNVSLFTLSGVVKDSAGNTLKAVAIAATDTTTYDTTNAQTDDSGNYSMKLKAGTYNLGFSLAGYIPTVAPATVIISANKTFSVMPSGDQEGLVKSTAVISGTIKKPDGITSANDGYVSAANANGIIVAAPIDPTNGTYSLPVVDGTWTVNAIAPKTAKTEDSTPVIINGADVAGNNLTLTVNNDNATETATASISANTGGTIESDSADIKATFPPGVLESGSGTDTITEEKSFTAPDTTDKLPLGDAFFSVNATGASTIKDLKGDANIQLDYSNLIAKLPADVSESNLIAAYYDQATNSYVPCEDGSTVDTVNNKVTCVTPHLTDFAIVYAPVPPAAPAPAPAPQNNNNSSSGGSGSGYVSSTPSTVTPKDNTQHGAADKTVNNETVNNDSGKNNPEKADYSDHWAATYIQKLYDKKVVSGCSDVNYCPDKKITKAEMLKIAMNINGLKVEEGLTGPFKDTKDHWAKDYIATANKLGIIKSTTKFHPDAEITRAEALKILFDAAKVVLDKKPVKNPFYDLSTKYWAYSYIITAYEKGVVGGYTIKNKLYFKPEQTVTRAEMAKIAIMVSELSTK